MKTLQFFILALIFAVSFSACKNGKHCQNIDCNDGYYAFSEGNRNDNWDIAEIHMNYPVFNDTSIAAIQELNTAIRTFVDTAGILYFRANIDSTFDYKQKMGANEIFELKGTSEIKMNVQPFISVLISSFHITIGKAPDMSFRAFNYDVERSVLLNFEDIFNMNKLEMINNLIKEELKANAQCDELLKPIDRDYKRAVFVNEGVMFYFTPEEIGGKDCSNIAYILISYDKLNRIKAWHNSFHALDCCMKLSR